MGIIPLVIAVIPRTFAIALGLSDRAIKELPKHLTWFRELFTDLGPPTAIGRRYLEHFPRESNCVFLQTAITRKTQLHQRSQLRRLLAQKREHDFLNEDIAIVDGWVLSRTEARTCALIALLEVTG